MKPEKKTFPRKLKSTSKGFELYGFGIVEYSIRSESGRMIKIWAQEYSVAGLPKDLQIISPQRNSTSEGYKDTFISHFHGEHDSYAELNLKEDETGWKKAKPVESFHIKYDPNNNLPYHETILPNQR